MPRMTKYQLEHFESKVKRRLDPLIEEQELLIKQYTTEATNKASKKLAIKIGAQPIIDNLRNAQEALSKAQISAQSFFEKKATTKGMKAELNTKFDKDSYRYDDDKITLSDCEEQLRSWAKALAEREIEKRPEGKQLAKLNSIRRSALDSILESEAPSSLMESLNSHMQKYLGVSWHEEPKSIEYK